MWEESGGRHLACEFAKGSDDSDDGCLHALLHISYPLCMVFGSHGVWVIDWVSPHTKLVTKKTYGLLGIMGYQSYGL